MQGTEISHTEEQRTWGRAQVYDPNHCPECHWLYWAAVEKRSPVIEAEVHQKGEIIMRREMPGWAYVEDVMDEMESYVKLEAINADGECLVRARRVES